MDAGSRCLFGPSSRTAAKGGEIRDPLDGDERAIEFLRSRYTEAVKELSNEAVDLLKNWPAVKEGIRTEQYSYTVRGKEISGANYRESLSKLQIPKLGMPRDADWGELLSFLMREYLPGAYPCTAGTFPSRRVGEDPIRMFAGEGTPERTNRRFHLIAHGQPAGKFLNPPGERHIACRTPGPLNQESDCEYQADFDFESGDCVCGAWRLRSIRQEPFHR